MSTRAVIGVYTDRKATAWQGVYHHYDGYPSGLGRTLWHLYHERYAGRLGDMLKLLIDDHPEGWSSIVDVDWGQSPTWKDPEALYGVPVSEWPPLAYKYRGVVGPRWHYDTGRPGWLQWAYIFDARNDLMAIYKATNSGNAWGLGIILALDQPEPVWETFEG